MTETLQPMADEVDPQQLAEQLLAQAKAQGVDLVGPNGLLNQLTKNRARDRPGGGDERAPGLRAP